MTMVERIEETYLGINHNLTWTAQDWKKWQCLLEAKTLETLLGNRNINIQYAAPIVVPVVCHRILIMRSHKRA